MDWLRDAHAMEDSIATMLEKQAAKLDDRPAMKSRIEEHLDVTREQRERVKGLIEGLGGKTSKVKDTTAKILSNIQAMTAGSAPDNAVKFSIANLAVEHFEIASYRSLIAAAEELGQTDVVRVCRENLAEEEEMARWVDEQIPVVTTDYLSKAAATQR